MFQPCSPIQVFQYWQKYGILMLTANPQNSKHKTVELYERQILIVLTKIFSDKDMNIKWEVDIDMGVCRQAYSGNNLVNSSYASHSRRCSKYKYNRNVLHAHRPETHKQKILTCQS